MPVPSQGHYGFHSFPVVDWFCLFIYLWVLTFPLLDCSEFGNCVITLMYHLLYLKYFNLPSILFGMFLETSDLLFLLELVYLFIQHINVHTTLLLSIVDQIPATSSCFLCTIFSNVGVHALCGQRFILISDYSFNNNKINK